MEYGMMVRTFEVKPSMEDATANEISNEMVKELGKIMQPIAKALTSLPEGKRGELLSHNIVRIGSHIIVSFLFRMN